MYVVIMLKITITLTTILWSFNEEMFEPSHNDLGTFKSSLIVGPDIRSGITHVTCCENLLKSYFYLFLGQKWPFFLLSLSLSQRLPDGSDRPYTLSDFTAVLSTSLKYFIFPFQSLSTLNISGDWQFAREHLKISNQIVV